MTQHEKILKLMGTDINRWWLPHDFMQPQLGDLFVGYESSARLSELAKLYPEKIESKREGKYIARRLKPTEPRKTWSDAKAVSWLND